MGRSHYPVLVAEAQAIGSVAVIRSLGRAGYPVYACSSRSDALGFSSKYTRAFAISPKYSSPDFVAWLRNYVCRHGIRAVIPSEGLLLAIRHCFSEFRHLLPVSTDAEIVYRGMSKFDLFEALLRPQGDPVVNKHLPPTILIDDTNTPPTRGQLARLGSPLYLKLDGCYSTEPPETGAIFKCQSADEAYTIIGRVSSKYKKALIQAHVPGRGVGAFFLSWNGTILAEFMHRRIHEVPHTGGVSSLRESWFHGVIRDDALQKLRLLGWEGVAMMEYRWDSKTDDFYLMEMNGRFWGSLHLALHAGADFPLLLMDAFCGRLPTATLQYRRGVRCRYTVPKEIEYVWSRLKDRELSWLTRIGTVVEFFRLSLDPRIYSDLSFPGDRGLYWKSLTRFLQDHLTGKQAVLQV